MQGSHWELGGLSWGSDEPSAVHATWPLAHLRVDTARLELRVFPLLWRTIVLRKDQILSVSARHGTFSGSLRFEHTSHGNPRFLIFRSLASLELCHCLKGLGYPIAR